MSKRQAAKERAPKAALQWAAKKTAQPAAEAEDEDHEESDSELLEPVGVEEEAEGAEGGNDEDAEGEAEASESYSDASEEAQARPIDAALHWLTLAQEEEATGAGPSKIPLEDYSDSSEDEVSRLFPHHRFISSPAPAREPHWRGAHGVVQGVRPHRLQCRGCALGPRAHFSL